MYGGGNVVAFCHFSCIVVAWLLSLAKVLLYVWWWRFGGVGNALKGGQTWLQGDEKEPPPHRTLDPWKLLISSKMPQFGGEIGSELF